MTDDEPKSRRNVTLPQSINDKLAQDHINASGLIADLLRAYFAYSDVEEAVEYTAEVREEDREKRIEDTLEDLEGADANHKNPAVLRQAAALEIPPEQLAVALEQYRDDGTVPDL